MNKNFESIYHTASTFDVSAHGRVNLIGEHTDYNGGFVLPTLIPQVTQIWLRPRDDKKICLFSMNMDGLNGGKPAEYILGEEHVQRIWTDYAQGITWVLSKNGKNIQGFDALIESQIPIGSGLSSSAALEVALLKALNKAFKLDIKDIEIARLAQQAEKDFVGARVGIMDHMSSALAQQGEALFIDTRNLEYERIPLPLNEVELLVINSGVHHSNSQGGYNQRRLECENASQELEVKELRDVTDDMMDKVQALSKPLRRRVLHVISENRRVLEAVEALRKRDFAHLGFLFNQSHLSMRDDYEVSVPEIDLLVELCSLRTQVYGARLTGGGFGGSIVALVKKGYAEEVGREVMNQYRRKTNKTPSQLVPQVHKFLA